MLELLLGGIAHNSLKIDAVASYVKKLGSTVSLQLVGGALIGITLIKVIREQNARIDNIEARIIEIKSKGE